MIATAGALAVPGANASAATCAGLDSSITELTPAAAEAAVLCLTNAERAIRGLPVLAPDERLATAARRHSQDMSERDYFAHDAPAPAPFGASPGDRISAAGYHWNAYGENIAAGFATPRMVMAAWMASTGHCHNILDPGVTQLGVGTTTGAATVPRGVGTWTQDFGLPVGGGGPLSHDAGPRDGCPYAALAGVDSSGAVLATAPEPVQETPPPAAETAPAPASAPLAVTVHHAGRHLRIRGTLTAADRTRVRVIVRRRGHTLRRRRSRMRAGTFAVRMALPRRARGLAVTVRVAGHRVTRTIR